MARVVEITELMLPELEVYIGLNEPQLLHYLEPEPGLFIAESPNVVERALDAGYEPVSLLLERRQAQGEAARILDRCGEIPAYVGELSVLKKLTGYPMTRGVLAAMRRRPLPDAEEILSASERIAVLENVENPTNLGAIFRCAAALGMDAVLLAGGCADPLYRRAVRVSMGTVFQIPWTYLGGRTDSLACRGIPRLRAHGFVTAAMALTEQALPIDAPVVKRAERLAVLLGTEGTGLSEETIGAADVVLKIPMLHGVDSLNVAAAGAVAFWELGKRTTGEDGIYKSPPSVL